MAIRTTMMAEILEEGPFFHGTIADLRAGDFLTAGYRSNYRPEVVTNHIYFTAIVDGAGLAAPPSTKDRGAMAKSVSGATLEVGIMRAT